MNKSLSAAIGILVALLCISGTNAQSTPQYIWNLTSQDIFVMGYNETYTMPWSDAPNTKVYRQSFGRFTYFGGGVISQPNMTCVAPYCAVGVFVYTKNEALTAIPAGGLQFSATDILEKDSAPMLAFGNSSIAFRAQVAGFMSEPIIKNIAITLVAIIMVKKIFDGTWKILDVFKRKNDDESEESEDSGGAVYSDDSVSNGSE